MNAAVLVKTSGMDRQEWLEWRKKGIGGSDAAAIAGLNKWKSPMAVWLEKTGQVEPPEAGEAAYWGNVLEEVVAREFSARTGLKVWRRNAILQHPQYPFMLANLDRVIVGSDEGQGILECKTTNAFMQDEWEDDKVPDAYLIQVQHYLAVTSMKYAYIAVLIGGNTFKYTRIDRDDEMIGYLIKIESEFWKLVESNTPPQMDGSEASSEVLKRLYPKGKPTEIILPDEAESLITEYEEAKRYEAQWKERKEAAANKLKALLGENEIGLIGDKQVEWKNVNGRTFDKNGLKQDYPEIYAKYDKPNPYRRFAVKKAR